MKTIILKSVLRHALGFAGAWLIKNGILTQSDIAQASGAILVLVAFVHSLWDKRALIKAEWDKLDSGGSWTAIKMLAIATALAGALGMTGCASNPQVITHESGYGSKIHATVPVPFSGGYSLIDLSAIFGWFKSTTAIQPTGTNRTFTPSIAIADVSGGAEKVTGGVGTNGAAIGAGTSDKYLLISGDTAAKDATNVIILDGYNGYKPGQTNQ